MLLSVARYPILSSVTFKLFELTPAVVILPNEAAPATFKLPPIPSPPVTTTAPVMVLVDWVLLLIEVIPATFTLPPIPAPPLTIRAPLPGAVDCLLFVTVKILSTVSILFKCAAPVTSKVFCKFVAPFISVPPPAVFKRTFCFTPISPLAKILTLSLLLETITMSIESPVPRWSVNGFDNIFPFNDHTAGGIPVDVSVEVEFVAATLFILLPTIADAVSA